MADGTSTSSYPTVVDQQQFADSNVKAYNSFVDGLGTVDEHVQQPDQFRQWANQQFSTLPTVPVTASPSPDTQVAARNQETPATLPPDTGASESNNYVALAAATPSATDTTPVQPAPSDASSFSKWANNQAQSILSPINQAASNVKQDVTQAATTLGHDVTKVTDATGLTTPDTKPPQSLRDRNLISNQFSYQQDQQLTPEEAAAACGPTAAMAFARYQGRNPTIGEALALAKKNGWTPSLGMAGPNSEVSLLGQLGVESVYNDGAGATEVAQEVGQGRPVIIDTPKHYYAVDGYDTDKGLFHVGGSGLALRGGSEWMSWDQISSHGGGVRGDITIKGNQSGSIDQGPSIPDASSHQAFVASLLPTAQSWEKKTGIPAATWLAIGASESNWGKAGNALFGIKGQGTKGSLNSATWESEGGQRVNTRDDFRDYNTPDEAFQGFWNFLHDNPRYSGALSQLQAGDPQGFVQAINQAGYATDPNWSNAIASIADNQIQPLIGNAGSNVGRLARGTASTAPVNSSASSRITNIVSDAVHPQVQAFNDFLGNLPSLNDALGLGANYGTTPDNGTPDSPQGPSRNSHSYNDMVGANSGVTPSFGSNPEDITSPIDQARSDNSMPQVLGGPTPLSGLLPNTTPENYGYKRADRDQGFLHDVQQTDPSNDGLLSRGWNTFQAATSIPRQILQASYNPAVGKGFRDAWDYLNAGIPNSMFSKSPQQGQSAAQLAETSTTGPESVIGGLTNFSRQVIDGWQRSDPNQPIINRIDQATKLADTPSDRMVASESNRLESNLGPQFGPVAASAFRFSYNTLTDPMMVTVLESKAAQIGIPVGGLLANIYGHATGQTPQQIEDLTLTGMNWGALTPLGESLLKNAPKIARGVGQGDAGLAKGVGQVASGAVRDIGELADRSGALDQVGRLATEDSGMVGREPASVDATTGANAELGGSEPPVDSTRYYHGTGKAFNEPDAAHFDNFGSHGPAYYMASDPSLANDHVQARVTGGEGTNIRPINVPNNINLLREDAPIGNPLARQLGSFLGKKIDPSMSGADAYQELSTEIASFRPESVVKKEVNKQLSDWGIDGIQYQVDQKPVLAIFPESMGKLTNAISGTRFGSPPAVGGAIVGGLAGYNSDPNATPEQKAKNTLLGVATGATLGHVMAGGKLGLSIEDVGKPVENRVLGSMTEAESPSHPNQPYQLQHRLMDLKDLIVSHQQGDFQPNPDFPRELQPRNRTSAIAQQQVAKYAADFQPKQVTKDYELIDRGTPIVGSDNIVESGNGRAMTLKEIQSNAPEKWQAYQDAVKKEALKAGFTEADLAKFENPVLVREMTTPMTHADRVAFAREANGDVKLGMSGYETARQDARSLPDDVFQQLNVKKGDNLLTTLRSSENAKLRQGFLDSMPFEERGEVTDSEGNLSNVGVARLQAAIVAKTFPGEIGQKLASTMIDTSDSKLKNIQAGITGALVPLAKAEALVTSGERDASLSITEDLARAVQVLNKVRTDKIPLKTYLSQQTFDEASKLTPTQIKLIDYLDKTTRTSFPLKDLLERYAKAVEAATQSGQMDFFGETAKVDKAEMVSNIIEAQRKDGVFGLKKATEVPKENPVVPAVPLTADEKSAAHMQDLAQKSLEGATGTPEQAAALRPDEPGHVGNILIKNVPEDTQPYLQKILDDANQFAGQRRGVVSDDQVIENAKKDPMSIEEMFKVKPGTAFTPEQVQTLKNAIKVYDGQLKDLKAQQKTLLETNSGHSDALDLAVVQKTLELRALLGVYTGAAAEGGRTLRAFAMATGDPWSILYRVQKKAAAKFGVDPSVMGPLSRDFGKEAKGIKPFEGDPSRLPTPEELAKMRAENEGARQGAMPPGKDIPVGDPAHVWTPEEKAAFKLGASGARQGSLTPERIVSDHPLTPEEKAAFKAGIARAYQGTLLPVHMGSDHIWSPEEAEAWQLGARQDTLRLKTDPNQLGRTPHPDDWQAPWKELHGREPTDAEKEAFRLGVRDGSQPTLGLKTDQVMGEAPTAAEMAAWKEKNGRDLTPQEIEAWKQWNAQTATQGQLGIDAAPVGGVSIEKRLDAAYKALGTNAKDFHEWMSQWDNLKPGDTLGRYKMLQALGSPSKMRYIIAYGISNMLSSTHTMGIVLFHGGLMAFNRPVLELIKGNPKTAWSDMSGMANFTGQAFSNAALYFKEGMHSISVEHQLREGELDFQRDPFAGWKGIVVTPAARAIGAMHEFYTTLSYGGALMLEAQKESKATGRTVKALLDNPTDTMLCNATLRSHDDLSGGKPSWAAEQILKARNTAYSGKTNRDRTMGLLANSVFPFVRIPDYLLRNGVKIAMAPIWYPGAVGIHLAKAGINVAKGKSAVPELVKAQGDLRVGAVASLILWEFYQQALQGNITGAGPADPNQLAVLEQARNEDGSAKWQAHSVRVGNRWVDYGTLGGVFTVPLVVATAIAEAKHDDNEKDILAAAVRQANSFRSDVGATLGPNEQKSTPEDTKFFNDMGTNMAKSMMDISYIRTLGDIFKSIQDGHAWGALASPLIINPAEAMIPMASLAAQEARIRDDNAKAPGGMFQQIETRIPKLPVIGDALPNNTKVPDRVGALGGDVSSPQDLVSVLAPGKTSAFGPYDPAMHELARLDQAGTPVSLSVTSATAQGFGGNYQGTLQSPEQMRNAQQTIGTNARRYILNAMNTPGYAQMSDEGKANALNDAIAASDKQSNLALGNEVTRDEPHKAALAWNQIPKYQGVKGTPEEIAQRNLQISDANAKLMAIQKEMSSKHHGSSPSDFKGQASRQLYLTDNTAYKLLQYPRMDSRWLAHQHEKIDQQFNGALTKADQENLTGIGQTYLPLDTTQHILDTVPSGG